MTTLKFIIRALYHRNFRLFFFGQGLSLIGTWMQQIALSWLVYRMTNSAFLLGVVGFSSQIPSFFIAPFAGVLVDRWNQHRILIVTQSLAMLQAFILAYLVLTNTVTIRHIISLSIFLGLIYSLDIPTKHAILFELLDKEEDLGNAIALHSSMFNGARLIGPFIAGILIPIVGEGVCFLINAISFLFVIWALSAIRIKRKKIRDTSNNMIGRLKEGFVYAFGFSPIRSILLLLSLVSLMGVSYVVLMPIFATDILHGGPRTLGFLMMAAAIGALAGGVYLAHRKTVLGLGKNIACATALFGVSLVIFSRSENLWLSLLLLVGIGFGMMVQTAASNTVLQTIVDDDKRGRVMSFYAMSFMGMVPFGCLLAGAMASKIGPQDTVMIGGLACVIGALVFAGRVSSLRRIARPIYVKKGIIPET